MNFKFSTKKISWIIIVSLILDFAISFWATNFNGSLPISETFYAMVSFYGILMFLIILFVVYAILSLIQRE